MKWPRSFTDLATGIALAGGIFLFSNWMGKSISSVLFFAFVAAAYSLISMYYSPDKHQTDIRVIEEENSLGYRSFPSEFTKEIFTYTCLTIVILSTTLGYLLIPSNSKIIASLIHIQAGLSGIYLAQIVNLVVRKRQRSRVVEDI